MIKVLMLSTDQKILEKGSAAQKRMLEYGELFKELHIVVFTTQPTTDNLQLTTNTWVYPTNTKWKPLYFRDAYKIGKDILSGSHDSDKSSGNSDYAITTQDPFETGLIGWLLKAKFGLPLQLQIHTDIFSPYFRQESLKNRIRVLLARFLLPRADGIRVVSERIKQSLISRVSYPASHISVLPISVDVKKIRNKKVKTDLRQKYPDRDFIILMASRLTKEKNIGLAIDAMKELLSAKRLTLTPLLLIVGDGPERSNLESRIKNYELWDSVKIENWTDDLASYYKTADIFLLTSNYEGYGRTAIEAMAAGLPVIMTDVGLAGELLVDDLDGAVVPVGDKKALAESISRLANNKEVTEGFIKESEKLINSLPEKSEYLASYKESLEILASSQKAKLCYVLPKYDPNDSTHFSYLRDFLKEISKSFDIFLVVEKGEIPPADLGYRKAKISRISLWPILRARFSGYRDFYIHYSFRAAFWASLVVRIFGGRVFYWNCGEPWKYRRNFLRELFEDSAYHLITFLVTGTESLAKQYANYYKIPLGKIKIMSNWINLDRIMNQESRIKKEELGIKEGTKILLFAHRLSKRKGAHYLPEIAKNLNPIIHDSLFVILVVGDGPEREEIELRIKNYELGNKVRFLGSIPNHRLPGYYSLADVFIMPSDEEGFPHVLLESMAAGTPFVASDVGSVKEIIPEAMQKYAVKAGDVLGFSDKINELLLKSPKELEHLGESLKDWVKRYDLPIVARKFTNLINNG